MIAVEVAWIHPGSCWHITYLGNVGRSWSQVGTTNYIYALTYTYALFFPRSTDSGNSWRRRASNCLAKLRSMPMRGESANSPVTPFETWDKTGCHVHSGCTSEGLVVGWPFDCWTCTKCASEVLTNKWLTFKQDSTTITSWLQAFTHHGKFYVWWLVELSHGSFSTSSWSTFERGMWMYRSSLHHLVCLQTYTRLQFLMVLWPRMLLRTLCC